MTENKPHDASTILDGGLAYGIRRLRPMPDAAQAFRADFEAFSSKHAGDLHGALAFPEVPENSQEDTHQTQRWHILLWFKGDVNTNNLLRDLSSDAFAAPDSETKDPDDGVFRTYTSPSATENSGSTEPTHPEPTLAVQTLQACRCLAGYLRPPPPDGSTTNSRPMLGIFQRRVQAGHRQKLAEAFRSVCGVWHATVPGILGACVFADPSDPDSVHDVRVFADKVSYDAHVNKSNPSLVAAMEAWFGHYDTSVAHTGIMVAADTSDPATRTSSVRNTSVTVRFCIFHYGPDEGGIGTVLGLDVGGP